MDLPLTEEQAAFIKIQAEARGVDEAAIIREIIDRVMPSEAGVRKRPRSIGAFASDNVRERDFDEWIAANWERDW
jgi:hypothetical protein